MSKTSYKNSIATKRLSLIAEKDPVKHCTHHYIVVDPHQGGKRIKRVINSLSTEVTK